MRNPVKKGPIHVGRQILLNIGFDATPRDCNLFLSINHPEEVGRVSETDLNEWRSQWQKDLGDIIPPLTAERTQQTIEHLSRSDVGLKMMAERLIGTAKGRAAIRDAMQKLPIAALRQLLGLTAKRSAKRQTPKQS